MNKEVRQMTNKTNKKNELVRRMVQIIYSYDTTPQYIDSYRQEMEALERNRRLNAEFNSVMSSWLNTEYNLNIYEYDSGVPAYLQPVTKEKVEEWLKPFEAPAWVQIVQDQINSVD